ncbi:MAG: 6-carboxytetrahydropterin synthase QueD [Elusimicrobiota bacterium]
MSEKGTYEITVRTKFSAAHNLRNYKGDCENVHGHNWNVKVTAAFTKLKGGLSMDFRELKGISKKVIKELDHKNINEVNYFKQENPTSENVARYIYDRIKKEGVPVIKVSVSETDDYTATYKKEK